VPKAEIKVKLTKEEAKAKADELRKNMQAKNAKVGCL
jgi:hypothetical protein